MHPSSKSIQVATPGPFLRGAFVLVLTVAALAGALMTASTQMGLAALGFALLAGPLAVIVEDRSRGARQSSPIPVTSVATSPAAV